MNISLQWTITVFYWIAFPIYTALYLLAYYIFLGFTIIMHPLYVVLMFVLQPVIYLGLVISYCVTWPFYFLLRFETLYIFLGTAGLIGLASGLLLHFYYGFMYSLFGLAPHHNTKKIRTAKEYRESVREREPKSPIKAPLSPTGHFSDGNPSRGRRGLLSQTILEETDSDF